MKDRDHSIDVARGIASILVLIGHIHSTPRGIYIWIYSFHMALFFIISGMVLNIKHSFGNFIKRRIYGLVVPYFTLSFIVWSTESLIRIIAGIYKPEKSVDFGLMKNEFIGIFEGYRLTKYYYIMWFVSVSFFAVILCYLLIRILRKSNLIYTIGFILIFINYLIWQIKKGFYFSLDAVLIASGLMMIGNNIHNHKIIDRIYEWNKKSGYLLALISCILSGISFALYGGIDLYNCIIPNPLVFLMLSFVGSLSILLISRHISKNVILEYVSTLSIVFYAFQNKLVIPVADKISKALIRSIHLSGLFGSVTQCLITLFLAILSLLFIGTILIKVCPWAIGKKNENSM